MGIAYVPAQMAGLRSRCNRRHRFVRGAGFFLLTVLLLAGCSSAPEYDPNLPPPATDILQYDVAFQLVAPLALAERVDVYTDVGQSLAEGGRIQRAADTLTFVTGLLAGGTMDEPARLRARARLVSAWQAVAARDETRAADVDAITEALLDDVDRVDVAEVQEEVFARLFAAQLDNPNAGEDAVRRTLDLAYLIDSDPVRAETLVEAAEQVEGRDDRVALNPLVQQAIATVPALDNPLLAADLSARLAVLSQVLGRDADAGTLVNRILQRSEAGLIVEAADAARLNRIVADLVRVERSSEVPTVLANVAPQRMRALAYGWYAASLWETSRPGSATDAFTEGYRLASLVGDAAASAEVRSELIRIRAAADPQWDAAAEAASLLADVRLSAISGQRREAILVNVAIAYIRTGRPDLVDRLRGLIATGDEFARVTIRIAEGLQAAGLDAAAVEYLRSVSTMPPAVIGDDVDPAIRAARVWFRLEEYDRGIAVAIDRDPLDLATLLAAVPADHTVNPATRGQLVRRANGT